MSIKSYQLGPVLFPSIHFKSLPGEQVPELTTTFKTIIYKISPDKIQFLFGVMVKNADHSGEVNTAKHLAVVDCLAEVIFDENLPENATVRDIKFIPNIMATLYPFLRERVANLFSTNNSFVLLPPENFVAFYEKSIDKIKIVDLSKELQANE